jgi:hypothetical protein
LAPKLPSVGTSEPHRPRGRLQSVTAQALALVPLAVGLVFGAVALPRSVPPDAVPSPSVDARVLTRVAKEDDARALRVAAKPLSSTVRAVGSDFRAFNEAEATGADEATIAQARDAVVRSVRGTKDSDIEGLLDLRAYQLGAFLAEARQFERTGAVSAELRALGGTFIDRMTTVGWCYQHHLAMGDAVRRAAFKLTWNRVLLFDGDLRFALTLDETRELYAFYFSHPHASEAQRLRFEAAVKAAPDDAARARAIDAERVAIAGWLLAKVGELSQVDPSYPTVLARGAALYMKHDYSGSAASYEAWLEAHPGGLWTLRAQNHLRAALLASRAAI